MLLLQSVAPPSEQQSPPELVLQLHECLLMSGSDHSLTYTFSKENVQQLDQVQ